MGCWINGVPQETIAASDRGLSYGDGLFETIAVVNSRPRLLNAHLARLEKGLQRLRFPVGTLALVKEDLARLDFQGDQTLKITVTREVVRGVMPFPIHYSPAESFAFPCPAGDAAQS